MRKIIYSALIISVSILSTNCTKNNNNDCEILTYECFDKNLTKDMKYSQIVDVFGEPNEDTGSGIHIYTYILKDKSQVYIGYTDKILYAFHVDKNQNPLHDLI